MGLGQPTESRTGRIPGWTFKVEWWMFEFRGGLAAFLMRSTPLALLMVLAMALGRAAPIQHEFVAIDEGLGNLLHVDERDPAKNWIVKIAPDVPQDAAHGPKWNPAARDMQLVGGGRLLISHDAGYAEYDIATGKKLKDLAIYKGVSSARRLPNGHTLVAGVNLEGETGVTILDLTPDDKVASKTVFPGTYVRLLRETAQGTWLMMNDSMIREGDRTGKLLHEWTIPGFRHAWKAVRLPNGHTFASAGYGAFFVELDGEGKVAQKFAAKEEMPPAVHANFYAMYQLLPNGHIVFANWQAHGPGHGASGVQLLELDEKHAIVWQWSEAKLISSLQGVLVLDGLDRNVLHDEREGVMAPLVARH